jgi:hypothetical protein
MVYRHPRVPLSRERKMRVFWNRSFRVRTATDHRLADANPNPERDVCPSLYLLFAAGLRRLPVDHPTCLHLTECSPCYREVRGIQQTESGLWTWRFRPSRTIRLHVLRAIRRLRDAESRRAAGLRFPRPDDGAG